MGVALNKWVWPNTSECVLAQMGVAYISGCGLAPMGVANIGWCGLALMGVAYHLWYTNCLVCEGNEVIIMLSVWVWLANLMGVA